MHMTGGLLGTRIRQRWQISTIGERDHNVECVTADANLHRCAFATTCSMASSTTERTLRMSSAEIFHSFAIDEKIIKCLGRQRPTRPKSRALFQQHRPKAEVVEARHLANAHILGIRHAVVGVIAGLRRGEAES
jgi:hypothetical protein